MAGRCAALSRVRNVAWDGRRCVVLDDLLSDREGQNRLDDRHRLDDRRLPEFCLLQLDAEARDPFRAQLTDAVVTQPRQDVQRPHTAVKIACRLAQIRYGVQSPVGLHEFPHLDVVGNRCLTELLAAPLDRQKALSVCLRGGGPS